MNKTKALLYALLSVFMCMAAAPAYAADAIKIGVILPLTGSQAKEGYFEKSAIDMAFEEINAKGGVGGKKLEAVVVDSQSKPYVAKNAANQLVEKDKVTALIGGYASDEAFEIASVSVATKTPYLVHTGSADKITELASFKGAAAASFPVFRMNQPASEWNNGLKSFLTEVVKPKTAGIVYDKRLFGANLAEAFEAVCKETGVSVVFKESFDSKAKSFNPVMFKLKQAKPDVVYMVAYASEAPALMKEAISLGINPMVFAGAGAGFAGAEFQDKAGADAEGVVSTTLWDEALGLSGSKEFAAKFRAKHKKDQKYKYYGKKEMEISYHVVEAYSAPFVLADALGRAKSTGAEDVRAALAATDVKTAFGAVKFGAYGSKVNQNKLDTYVVQWHGDSLDLIWPKEVAKSQFAPRKK
ncbi:MAG: ABC transporter substrate-binding protein [Nitrospinae bacterium]|nr:ABC transporter substrate-binding protein [Nitrospinota bacterium]